MATPRPAVKALNAQSPALLAAPISPRLRRFSVHPRWNFQPSFDRRRPHRSREELSCATLICIEMEMEMARTLTATSFWFSNEGFYLVFFFRTTININVEEKKKTILLKRIRLKITLNFRENNNLVQKRRKW